MAHQSVSERADRLAHALAPEQPRAGIAHGIREQVLADALTRRPPPRTVSHLLGIVERDYAHRGEIAVDLIERLRRRARRRPDRLVDEVIAEV